MIAFYLNSLITKISSCKMARYTYFVDGKYEKESIPIDWVTLILNIFQILYISHKTIVYLFALL